MVGTPRSAGCATCRKRKKKCGEERPECRLCVIAGWKCPGYEKRWKFVDENQQLLSYYRQKRYIFEDVDFGPAGASLEDVLRNESDNASESSSRGGWHIVRRANDFPIFSVLTSGNDHNAAFLVHVLEDPTTQSIFPLRSHGNYLDFIPSLLGRNPALDTVVSCLGAMYTHTLAKTASTAQVAMRTYVRSLEALRLCLEDEQRRLESETICASVLLQLCELMTEADNGRWNHLCQGSKLLIQERGPASFVTPFERAMLESQRAFFLVQDGNAGVRSFLSQAPWREILRRPTPCLLTQGPLSIPLRSQLCDFLVDILEMVADASENRSGLFHETGAGSLHERTLLRIVALHRNLEEWYINRFQFLLLACTQSSEVQLDGPEATPTVVEYPEILFAVLDSVSNTALLVLEKLYTSLSAASPHRPQPQSLETTICPRTTAARREMTVRTSLDFVRRKAQVAAQPLEFGLRQIWSSAMALTGEPSP